MKTRIATPNTIATISGRLACMCIIALCAEQGFAQVTATPDTISFEALDQRISVALARGGEPVPASAITGFNLFVDQHDYAEMFTMETSDGSVTFTPTRYVEIGSYRLVIFTTQGDAEVRVYTPLSTMPNTLEEQAAALGVTVDRVRELMGMTGSSGPGIMRIELPEVHYVGQKLTLTLPQDADAVFSWSMNGVTVKEGLNEHAFEYVFPEPGPYLLTHTQSKGGRVLAAASASTNAAREPAVKVGIQAGREVTVAAPSGYNAYSWKADGVEVSTSNELRHTFAEPGEFRIDCRATEPIAGDRDLFRIVTYEFSVRP